MPHRYCATEVKPFGGPPGYKPVELGEPEGMQRIQRLAQGVGVVEMFRVHPGPHQPLGRFVAEELGHTRYRCLLAKPRPFKTKALRA